MVKVKNNAVAARFAAKLRTPFAVLGIRTGRGAVTGVDYLPLSERAAAPADAVAERACRQVERYLDDGEFRFDLPLAPAGSAFQRRGWDRIAEIPAGESRTYGQLPRPPHTAGIAAGGRCGAHPTAALVP